MKVNNIYIYIYIYHFLLVKLPCDLSRPSVGRLVGWSVGLPVIISSLTSHAPIVALVYSFLASRIIKITFFSQIVGKDDMLDF